VGFLEVRTSADVTKRDGAVLIDFGSADSDAALELNGRHFRADNPADLATAVRARRSAEADRILAIPYQVETEGSRVIIGQDARVPEALSGSYLTGSEAQAAADRASRIAESDVDAWPAALEHVATDALGMGGLATGPRWDGPLVVSMPRTGSTLLGVLFLFCGDAGSATGYRFDRYLHEPVAPVFWRGDGVESISRLVAPLSDRDVVQESAYQFADPRVAKWFLSRARSPVVFTMRHPQLAWPSRWRAMLAQMVDESPADSEADAARRALSADDFSGLGSYLTESVRPADNGFYAFVSLLGMCIREDIDFVIVDNTRFRAHPEAAVRELCGRIDIEFDRAMTEWSDLGAVLPRVVMSDLARGEEYRWYYERTLGSDQGIRPETHALVDPARFPDELRGVSDQYLTIDEAVTWYQLLLARPETLP
jgi:hypothetical protein